MLEQVILWLVGTGNFEANTVNNNRKDNLEIGLFYYNLKKLLIVTCNIADNSE